ncbi:hypothetical protein BMG03_05760 [Thioclava nitratireducens]|uniref:PepSY domain-containing protein n=1 Tax=Thioclava nitratireducens TaxID=1915078 RepID=A0ABM6IF52_9RHOB|nr:PepSY domain-containing protein [Thioclava nitratireducens]AQS47357.1 hypothetical protein BMG03_05760 [Thioclava nitratireducens]
MRKTLTALPLIALLPAGMALADDDYRKSSRGEGMSRDAVMQMARENGWAVEEIEMEDGQYKIEGRDRDGRKIDTKLDPATLRLIRSEHDDDDEEDDDDDDYGASARNPAPAGTVAPPKNGLFGNGAPPKVQVN